MAKSHSKRLVLSLIAIPFVMISTSSLAEEPKISNPTISTANKKDLPHPFPLAQTVSYESLRIMAHSGKQAEAIKLAKEYLKYRENSSIRTLLARMLAWNKQYDEATHHINLVLQKHPGDFDASDTLADIELWQGRYDKAAEALSNALKYDPGDVYLTNKLVLVQAKQLSSNNETDQAIKVLFDRLKTNDNAPMRMYLASLYIQTNNYPSAKNQYELVLKSDPHNEEAATRLVEVESKISNEKSAIALIDDKIKDNPSNETLKKVKLKFAEASGSGKKIQLPSPIRDNTYQKIRDLEKKGERKQAIDLARRSLKKNDNTDIRTYLGAMLSWEKQYNEARHHLGIVLKQSPGHGDATLALANVEYWSDNDEEAIAVINQGLKYNPKNMQLIELKNKILASNIVTYDQLKSLNDDGERDKAKALAEKYLSRSENGDIRLYLAYMNVWDKDYDKAESHFKTVLKNNPSYSDASIGLATVEQYKDNDAKALSIINQALKYKPKDERLLQKRTEIISSINQTSSAGAFSLGRRTGYIPRSIEDKPNSLGFGYEIERVDDLQQDWKLFYLQYGRDTSFGSVTFTLNKADRFQSKGTQYLVESYPRLFKGAYAYLAYGYSNTSYFPRHYIGFEPFVSLPASFEASLGERILQFRSSTTHLYTGSIAKYIGNYWFAFRPYYSGPGSISYHLIARRYFSTPESYITLRIGTGTGPSTIDDPFSISSDRSRSISLSGQYPLCDDLLFDWGTGYSYEHFPNKRERRIKSASAGLTWLY